MQYSIAFVALAAAVAANPVSYSGASIPSCGWTTTLITEAGATDTVPIPLASADCGSSSMMPSSMPASTTPAAPVSSAPAAECSEYVDGQPQCSSAVPAPACSEYVDGQPQCSSAVAPVTTTAAVCSEYVDGQPQCSSAAPVSSVCSEYVDGQPQCGVTGTGYYPTGSGYAMPTGTGMMPYSSYSAPAATGAANIHGPAGALLAAGFAVAML